MNNEEHITLLINRIIQSKKYSPIDRNLVEKIVLENYKRYKPKEVENKVKNKLHQIWGIFYKQKVDYKKILTELAESRKQNKTDEETLYPLLHYHVSTDERTQFIREFYARIFEVTGRPNKIIDIGCGWTPLTYSFMNLFPATKYYAYDIDCEEITFLQQAMQIMKPDIDFHFEVRDAEEILETEADVVFMFKLLQVLEQIQKGSALELMKRIKAKHIVVSFPAKSVSGKEKGMTNFYSAWFEELTAKTNFTTKKLDFPNEIVYILNH